MDKIIVTGFRWAPPFAQGLVRDLRVRWALEEAGRAYETQSVDIADLKSPTHVAHQPFGMVPAVEVHGQTLFESGAIVHLIAADCATLMPPDPHGRALTTTWMFAALNTVEPSIQTLLAIDFQHSGEPWADLQRPLVVETVKSRLRVLAAWLEGRDYLLEGFTAADILMVTVLRFIRHTDLVSQFPLVDAYVKRCEARPTFQRALGGQMADYAHSAPVAA
jgi:glutathione S-transferase